MMFEYEQQRMIEEDAAEREWTKLNAETEAADAACLRRGLAWGLLFSVVLWGAIVLAVAL
jgi:hypothetical protein